jgi:hypothetical protein
MDGRRHSDGYQLPASARLSHDLLWAQASVTGRRPRLDDLEAADRLAALLIERWRPAAAGATPRWPWSRRPLRGAAAP